ncbi:MAG: SIR2 family NAD-dependent protein deacylase [Anaerolineae bacterium]
MIHIPAGLADLVAGAKSIAVLTGAGVSAESGISTFRDAHGLWSRFNPDEVATREAFLRDPVKVWDWYAERRVQIALAEPHAGHYALVEMERRSREFALVTQNIDEMHRRAGTKRLIELHGSISRVKCFDEDVVVDEWDATGEVPPRCPQCGSRLRPDVVWFGESLPIDALGEAIAAAQRCDVFISVGTSGLVEPAASLPFEALRARAAIIEVNPEETPVSPFVRYALRAPAGEALPALVRAAWPGSELIGG